MKIRNLIVVASFAACICAIAVAIGGFAFLQTGNQHVVKFSGKKYSPNTLTVNIGDVITWQGDFSEHPLSLISAPKGAATFSHIQKGSSYSYTVHVAGNYRYECDMHADEGMAGSFTAVAK